MWVSAGFLIGIILGSLVHALADRSLGKNSFWGRSYCPKCRHQLAWYDLFPVISYLLLKGKCRYCHKKIPIDYLLIELAMGLLIGILFWQYSDNFKFLIFNLNSNFKFQISNFILELIIKTFFIVVLGILFLTDLRKMLIPDRIIKPAIWIGAISLLLVTIYKIGYLYYYLSQSIIGRLLLPPNEYFQRHALLAANPFIAGVAMALAIGGFFYLLILITKGKGMGGGDVKLGAFIGIMLGFPNAVLAFFLSFILGAIFSIGLIISGKKHFGQAIPFGPFLVLGSLISLFWGNRLIELYLGLGT